jgi:hypothetical protein
MVRDAMWGRSGWQAGVWLAMKSESKVRQQGARRPSKGASWVAEQGSTPMGPAAQGLKGSMGSRALVQHTTPPSLTHSPPTYIQYKPLRLPITHRGWGSLRGARLDPLRGRRMLCFCWIRLLLPNYSTAKVSGAPGDDRVGRVGKVVLGRASWQGLSSWLYSNKMEARRRGVWNVWL